MLWTIIVTIVGGVIIGLLGRMAAPGSNKIGFGLTIVCGIVGMIVGSLVYYGIFKLSGSAQHYMDAHPNSSRYGWDNTTKGIDWWRHIWQIVVAALAVMAASFVTGRNRRA